MAIARRRRDLTNEQLAAGRSVSTAEHVELLRETVVRTLQPQLIEKNGRTHGTIHAEHTLATSRHMHARVPRWHKGRHALVDLSLSPQRACNCNLDLQLANTSSATSRLQHAPINELRPPSAIAVTGRRLLASRSRRRRRHCLQLAKTKAGEQIGGQAQQEQLESSVVVAVHPLPNFILPSSARTNTSGARWWHPSHACHPPPLTSLLPSIPSCPTTWMMAASTAVKLLLALLLVVSAHAVAGIRVDVIRLPSTPPPSSPTAAAAFREAPAFRNGDECPPPDEGRVHVAMTLDANYLRGTMAAVFSILQHTACPESVAFHFLAAARRRDDVDDPEPDDPLASIRATFPYLDPTVHRFDPSRVRGRISRSVRHALDQPLNYARIYLADTLPADVRRVIYLDSDVVVVDDVRKLWSVDLEGHVVAAPEYCHANFTKYFTDAFWGDAELRDTFRGRRPCYFNTGVMVMDVAKWRLGGYTRRVEEWMAVQKQKRIYHLGSLPPFLLVLAGDIKAVDHRWNQHGLGGDNMEGRCRSLHPGPISLLHWSGKGKPWLRLDSRKPCTVDYLWAPYDLYKAAATALEDDRASRCMGVRSGGQLNDVKYATHAMRCKCDDDDDELGSRWELNEDYWKKGKLEEEEEEDGDSSSRQVKGSAPRSILDLRETGQRRDRSSSEIVRSIKDSLVALDTKTGAKRLASTFPSTPYPIRARMLSRISSHPTPAGY
nr:unnamed protein product [Digitaria exilis]